MHMTQKGGIETIIAVIILAGIVVALIITSILPAAKVTKEIGNTGTTTISDLKDTISTGK